MTLRAPEALRSGLGHPVAPPDIARYVSRKTREIALLERCLEAPPILPPPASVEAAVDMKFRLAGALRAERSLASWAITETARPQVEEWRSGAYTLSYGYQRADLAVRGPPIYPMMDAHGHAAETMYTCAGMAALSALLAALSRTRGMLDVHAPRDGYSETRELLEGFVPCARLQPFRLGRTLPPPQGTRVLLVDSISVRIPHTGDPMPLDTALVILDTTCYWRSSGRIARVVRWARHNDVPLALVRSHNKLDSLGIEYGRLGSIVLSWRRSASRWMRDFTRETRNAIRLLGVAAIPAHLPPFVDDGAYARLSAERTATLIRNTRRLNEGLRASPLGLGVVLFPHGLYVTIAPSGELRVRDVKRAVEGLCAWLVDRGLPARHAGSFGFDFVAIEWFCDSRTRKNVIRVAPGDGPQSMIDALTEGIVEWFSRQTPGALP